MTEIEKLVNIDNEISIKIELIKNLTDTLKFTEICQFKLSEKINEIPWDNLGYSGIYQIEIKNDNKHIAFSSWVDEFKLSWEDEMYRKKFVPNLKKKRIQKHDQLNDWIPIYIGKSKNIGIRIIGHIYEKLEKTTFAMKLLARENLKNDIFKLSTIRVDVKNYDIIVPLIEKNLRDKINPIIGKQ